MIEIARGKHDLKKCCSLKSTDALIELYKKQKMNIKLN